MGASSAPDGYGAVTPYIIVKGAAAFIDFLVESFGAVERFRVPNDDGTLGHAEVDIDGTVLAMFDAKPDWPETPAYLTLWVTESTDTLDRELRRLAAAR